VHAILQRFKIKRNVVEIKALKIVKIRAVNEKRDNVLRLLMVLFRNRSAI